MSVNSPIRPRNVTPHRSAPFFRRLGLEAKLKMVGQSTEKAHGSSPHFQGGSVSIIEKGVRNRQAR